MTRGRERDLKKKERIKSAASISSAILLVESKSDDLGNDDDEDDDDDDDDDEDEKEEEEEEKEKEKLEKILVDGISLRKVGINCNCY